MGTRPVQPGLGVLPTDLKKAEQGVLIFRSAPVDGWYGIKTLWFAWPGYHGPLLIRGREISGSGAIAFGENPSLVDPQIPPGPTKNGVRFRQWPGGTWVREAGCYAWQVDGLTFSHVVVFRAVIHTSR